MIIDIDIDIDRLKVVKLFICIVIKLIKSNKN